MDIKPIIAKMAADCDLRNRFIKTLPGLLDKYALSPEGEIITCEPTTPSKTSKLFLDGFNLAGSVKINL
ncbi:MAG: hypothetical protein Q8O93_05300 [bacterium]|nr:hypothetical protein [bacterium]